MRLRSAFWTRRRAMKTKTRARKTIGTGTYIFVCERAMDIDMELEFFCSKQDRMIRPDISIVSR